MAEKELYLGMDLSPEYTQLSYYNLDTGEPESIYHNDSKDTYLLPNVLFYSEEPAVGGKKSKGSFTAGSSAVGSSLKVEGILIDRLYEKVMMNEDVLIGEKSYKSKALLVKLLCLHLNHFTDRYEEFSIARLVVTISEEDPYIIKALKELKKKLKLSDDSFEIVSHLDSGLYYIFNQPESLRNNSVALFDFGSAGLDYYRIDVTRNKNPNIISVKHKDMRDELGFADFKQDKEDLDDKFAVIAKKTMAESYISSVFLTGLGFTDNWMKNSAAVLCQGRRVFVGQNIYTKGACLRAAGGKYKDFRKRYFIDTEYTVKWDVGIGQGDEYNTFEPVVKGGNEWFSTRGKIYIILDDLNQVDIMFSDSVTGAVKKETIEIHGLPARPPKTTRISLEVEFYDNQKGAVIIRDEGFGKMFPTTNKIYRKEFDLGQTPEKQEE